MSRAQIHGYPINSIQFLTLGKNCIDYICSGGDEKVLRLLEPIPVIANYINKLNNNNE